jgi:[ribosomal protein S5]-alanine N-acetyltransferase
VSYKRALHTAIFLNYLAYLHSINGKLFFSTNIELIFQTQGMLILNFSPFPNLKTDRLILRRLTIEDQHEIFFLRFDESINKYVDRPKPNSLEDARKHIDKLNNGIDNNELIFWGITLSNNSPVIGTICLWNISKENDTAEVGFDLMPGFQGKGIMKEAFSEVTRYGFEMLKVRRLVAWVHHENSRSISLLSKFNFIRDIHEEEKADKIELTNMVIYTLTDTNYF